MSERHGRGDASHLLGSLEYDVLSVLWRDSPATVGVVRDRLNDGRPDDEPLAYTTVMTVLSRLFDKGLMHRDTTDRAYAYRPRFDEPELVGHLGQRAVSHLVDRYGDVALVQFAATLDRVDPATLARVRRLAAREESNA